MARPDTLTTMLRELISKKLAPQPKVGQAWCVRCNLNDGHTLVFPADGAVGHALEHKRFSPAKHVEIITRYDPKEPAEKIKQETLF